MNNNVCKFNFNRSSDLICLNYVKETMEAQAEGNTAGNYSMNLVIRGNGIFSKNSVEYPIEKGSLFFVCEGDDFSVRSLDGLEYFYIAFQGRRAEELAYRFDAGGANAVLNGYEELIPFWTECQSIADEDNIDLVCESVLLYSLVKLKPIKKEKNDVISKVISITQNSFTNADLSISSIASELGYDSKYLSTLFKKKKGINYTQYLKEQRIRHAIFLVEQGVTSVKNVALLSGFSDALYFSKIFTSAVGIPPKAYIQKNLKKDG